MAGSRINKAFGRLRRAGRKAFIPYIMAGDPSLGRTKELVHTLQEAGADIIELGVPFSDPLADGPVIQRAAERALEAGVSLRDVVATVAELRATTEVPIILMTYYNPILAYGLEGFGRDAAAAGVDGLIIPDLPPDEAKPLIAVARAAGLDTIFLVAPTSTPERMKLVARASTGFVYYVSMTGITGSTLSLGQEQRDSIEMLRGITGKPVALGFGVSTPEEARAVAEVADGVIVGSAIVKLAAGETGDEDFKTFLRALRDAIG